jgi:hypothetical protein
MSKRTAFWEEIIQKQGVKIIICNLDIIPNSGIIVLVKYVLNKKNQNCLCNSFMQKNKVIFLKHPVFLYRLFGVETYK